MQRLPDPLQWLEAGLPLTLLIDLLDPEGPRSSQILGAEPADAGWIPGQEAA